MSIQVASNPKLYQFDQLIQDKLETLLTNENIHSKFPDYQNCGVLEDPLQKYKIQTVENTEIAQDKRSGVIKLLRQERSDLVFIIKQLNEEKQVRRILSKKK